MTPAGLPAIATYADGIGAARTGCCRATPRQRRRRRRAVVGDAHDAGLVVHVWTLRRENQFMATNFRIGTDPNAPGDLAAEARAFLDAGVDGHLQRQPRPGRRPALADDGRSTWMRGRPSQRRTLGT